MGFNHGAFNGEVYEKIVDWNKAVLWKDREISLNPSITQQFGPRGIKLVRFIDKKKGSAFEATVDSLRGQAKRKIVGQEEQLYFPIAFFKERKLEA